MQLLSLALLCLARLLYSAETAGNGEVDAHVDDSEKTLGERMLSISIDMYSLHDDLRDERHDKATQLKGEAIRKAIQKLIDEARESDEKQEKQSQGGGDGSGMKTSKLTEYDGRLAKVKRKDEPWSRPYRGNTHEDLAKPIVAGDDALQGRWAARVAAYFLSVAVEQAEAERRWPTKPKKK